MMAATPRWPTYLRAVVTTKCPLSCSYCHMEGDPHQSGASWQLDDQMLDDCLSVAVAAGVRKFKFLGGEPLVRRGLAARIGVLRKQAPAADLSIITSGVAEVAVVEGLFAAGLSRMNVSIHGFTPSALAKRSRLAERHHAQRAAVLDYLLSLRRPLKLNYVYGGPADEPDLAALLKWAADHPVLVNVLDDLGRDELGPQSLLSLLTRLCGPWDRALEEPDPDSLPTTRLHWPSGLVVEVKTEQLGRFAPWQDCASCPMRARCREGIYAVRLTHRGQLQLCMDQPTLGVSLVEALKGGPSEALDTWQRFISSHLRDGSVQQTAVYRPHPLRKRLPVLAGEGML